MTNFSEMQNQKVNEQKDVPDGGWGWLVTFAAFSIFTLVFMSTTSYGILFSSLLIDNEASSALTFWIFNFNQMLFNISILFSGPISVQFGWRIVAFLGGILASLGLVASSFILKPNLLFFTYSILLGIGNGLAAGISFIIVPHYFNNKKGRAIGFSTMGICAGQFLGPIICTTFIEHHNSKGAILFLGGLLLLISFASLSFHPVERHLKKKPLDESLERMPSLPIDNGELSSAHLKSSSEELDILNGMNDKVKSQSVLLNVLEDVSNNISLLRYHRVKIISFSLAFGTASYINFIMIVPFILLKKGEPLDTSMWAISGAGLSHWATVLLLSSLTDVLSLSTKYYSVAGNFGITLSLIVFTFIHDFKWTIVVMCVFGVSTGTISVMMQLSILEFVGLQYLQKIIGIIGLIIAFMALTFGPSLGFINDVTGSYTSSIIILASTTFLSGCMWFAMNWAIRCDRHKDEQIEKENILELEFIETNHKEESLNRSKNSVSL